MTTRAIVVRGADAKGDVVVRFVLGHGEDPLRVLASHGWTPLGLLGARLDGDDVVLDVQVDRAGHVDGTVTGEEAGARPAVRTDDDLEVRPGEVAHVHQRLAAYAVMTHGEELLLAQLSATTSRPGQWMLPGGGVDRGERPGDGVVREVWEETGHDVDGLRLLDVHSSHWIGRAPSGRLEDFHALRLVYRGTCTERRPPVVHDVGGSTEAAAWVPFARMSTMPLTPLVAEHWRAWVSPPSGG